MNNHEVDVILKELSSISRMAVIEDAHRTEKMLVAYIKVLKYCYLCEEKMMIAYSELKVAEQLCEYYTLKSNNSFTYKIEENSEWQSVFIPQCALMACISSVLEAVYKESGLSPIELAIKLEKQKEGYYVQLSYFGEVNFNKVYELACEGDMVQKSSLDYAKKILSKTYNEQAFKLEKNNGKTMTIWLRVE